MELIYGMDPLCGWCFGIGPALARVRADHPDLPVRPVLAGLVTGERVGPYAQMEGYIRNASQRLEAVTGRAPSQAFFEMIRTPGVTGDSAPPSIAIAAVRKARPDALFDFVLRLTEAHFNEGLDLGDRATYETLFRRMGLEMAVPDLTDHQAAQEEWRVGRALGLTSFPSLWLFDGATHQQIAVDYDPARLSQKVGALISRVASSPWRLEG